MAELTRRAGLLAPEIEAGVGEVIVRFRPTKYVAPERVGHELSPLQRQPLQALAHLGACSLSEIMGELPAVKSFSSDPDYGQQPHLILEGKRDEAMI